MRPSAVLRSITVSQHIVRSIPHGAARSQAPARPATRSSSPAHTGNELGRRRTHASAAPPARHHHALLGVVDGTARNSMESSGDSYDHTAYFTATGNQRNNVRPIRRSEPGGYRGTTGSDNHREKLKNREGPLLSHPPIPAHSHPPEAQKITGVAGLTAPVPPAVTVAVRLLRVA